MRIVNGFGDAGWHDLRTSGAYEWWYFDALSDDGSIGFVFIFFAGLPFSPDYLTDHERGREPQAQDHAAVFAAVYRHGRQIAYALNRYGSDQFEAMRDGLDVRVGPSRAAAAADNGSIDVAVDLPLLFGGDRLTASVQLERRGRDFGFSHGDAPPDHVWNPLAPACAVAGELELTGTRPWRYAFRGRGYADHNYGTRPLTEGIRRWYWGRAHLGDVTVVYYHTEREDSREDTVLGIDDGAATIETYEDVGFNADGWKRRPLCPRFPTVVRLTARANVTVRVSSILDWGPFYMRFLADFTADVGGRTVTGTGISEYLDPRGLRARWLRPLIKTRIRRIG